MSRTKKIYSVAVLIILALSLTLSACVPVVPGGGTTTQPDTSGQTGPAVKLTWYLVETDKNRHPKGA